MGLRVEAQNLYFTYPFIDAGPFLESKLYIGSISAVLLVLVEKTLNKITFVE